ncbi:hypothetical protein ACFO3O_06150 [Dokdonia ponticola]|uniref:Uncharacterized protein n=1 Tax=Dokdonia ponticola TaxID=2041041 RepID=A0ABV9HTL5_9FLAO
MKPPICEIVYLNEDIDKSIIKDYWAIDETSRKWRYNINVVAKKHRMSMPNVSAYAKENSRLKLYCSKCKTLIGDYKLKSEINWQDFELGDKIECDDCANQKVESNKELREKIIIKEIEIKPDIAEKMNIAFKTEQWQDLNQPELEVLIKVAESTTTKEIFSKVFPDENWKSDYNKSWWQILNRLDRMNLIWIERKENRKIIDIHKHGRLYKTLLKEFPDLVFERKKIENPKKFGFTVERNNFKSGNQPDFLGNIDVNFDVSISKKTSLTCSIWYNKVDNLYIRIEDSTE